MFDSRQRSMRGHVVDLVRAGAAAAVLHARRHEQAHEVVLLAAHLRQHALVVVDGVAGRDRGVVPAVVQEQLAAVRLERRQIGVDGVDDRRRPSRRRASDRDRGRTSSHPSSRRCTRPETSRPTRRAPAGRRRTPLHRFRCPAPCPGRPTSPFFVFAGAYARFTRSSCGAVRQLVGVARPCRAASRRIEVAGARVVDQAVLHAVLRVAGVEHRLVQHRQLRRRHRCRRILQHRHGDRRGPTRADASGSWPARRRRSRRSRRDISAPPSGPAVRRSSSRSSTRAAAARS